MKYRNLGELFNEEEIKDVFMKRNNRKTESVALVIERKDLYMALEGFVVVGLFLLMWS
ncbi:MAG: hypothetical protein ACJAT2_001620 [Bacteriovoracaceae bacterium]